ncbi:hypothetical protein BOX07_gp35 [Pseudoalteromonas phage PH1]|uniref:hypothetical protein n=1 Tax=Pseudoalteromonas phage PH1 TaxID=1874540 RepID=UPI0008197CFC|nr:hypothetical protein BOX07_gp35 [Pseudoalteromonas phage PH1]ANY29546.1 hypothetical protein [Pseudoalteromonas phage PH1]
MTIKKQFEEIVALLEANKGKKVSTILPEILEMTKAKQQAKNFEVDEEGNVTRVYCYYHKAWEDVSECEYGAKKSSASGLNSMCKVGYNQWSKQQRDFKKAKDALLQQVADGEVEASELNVMLDNLEAERVSIVPRETAE